MFPSTSSVKEMESEYVNRLSDAMGKGVQCKLGDMWWDSKGGGGMEFNKKLRKLKKLTNAMWLKDGGRLGKSGIFKTDLCFSFKNTHHSS